MFEKLKKWINYQIKTIRVSDNQQFIDEITVWKTLNKLDEDTIRRLNETNMFLHNTVEDLREEIEVVNKHSSLENYHDFMDSSITPQNTYYNFGKGRKQVHTIFADSLKDEDIIRDFTNTELEFEGEEYSSADDMVYAFNKNLSVRYPTSKYYASDTTLYGLREYWATAKETIEKLRAGGKSYDCDDSMTLRYSCLYYLLQDYFPEDAWRIRGFIVDIWTGGGHALLAWIKEGVNDWIPIETTFYDNRMDYIWKKNYRIRNQMLYQIRYSFDNKNEYQRI